MPDDTIAAIATPLGEGGLAVIRISGPEALAVADRCFVPAGKSASKLSTAPTHTIHYGKIVRGGNTLDEAMAAVMRAPRTFAGRTWWKSPAMADCSPPGWFWTPCWRTARVRPSRASSPNERS